MRPIFPLALLALAACHKAPPTVVDTPTNAMSNDDVTEVSDDGASDNDESGNSAADPD